MRSLFILSEELDRIERTNPTIFSDMVIAAGFEFGKPIGQAESEDGRYHILYQED